VAPWALPVFSFSAGMKGAFESDGFESAPEVVSSSYSFASSLSSCVCS